MKKKAITIIAYLLVLIMLVGVLMRVTQVLEHKEAKISYGSFFDENENYDVWFAGSSRMKNGVYPMLLWKEYGITSYNIGAHAACIPETYWFIKNLLDYKKPKVIVVDTYTIGLNRKYSTPEFMHKWMDAIPFSMTKLQAIWDLIDDKAKDEEIANGEAEESSKGTVLEFIWSLCKYHSSWGEITSDSFVYDKSPEKGAEMRLGVFPKDKVNEYTDNIISDDSTGFEYLGKIVELCKEEDIQLVLVNLPMSRSEYDWEYSNAVKYFAIENNVPYIEFMDESVDVVDFSTDFFDEVHLNPQGAEVVSRYLGDYLIENCGIEDKRECEEASYWNLDYERYTEYVSVVYEVNSDLNL